ncbi:RHS repeat-associated core domain-containing protein [Flavobacterium limi]|uniref:RHS repeat-associated core domain-containing protein n=1 Tax=Flavobacterium limi TaxID=2045105 RepID=A0ABQ1US16_9FLAO|nr:RHS repeat-associated core domain-containing protein [Flavobacterium limi]GGF25802.1 hypothetical protein GCM10011518_38950 [Flavobacterium limi]
MMLDRGYTSHEHLAEVGLIHMNGRLYDPVLRSFLMPDNFIQQPENTQNYNRYAYVLNNPLMYTDPNGEVIIGFAGAVIIGATIAALTYTVTALLADVPAKATFIGAASAAVTYGIGSAAGTITNFYVRAAVSAVAHGAFQGGMTAISGGKFWSGFASGALSSIAASAWGGGSTTETNFETNSNLTEGHFVTTTYVHQGISGAIGANNVAGMIAFGTVSGGAGAALTGGNFWQGAVTGLVVSGLNHALHQIDPPGKKNKWDLDNNGKLSKVEADLWGVKGHGAEINVDNSKIDWTGLKIPEGVKIGEVFGLETHQAFIKLPWETAATYGGTSFLVTGKNTVKVLDQDYHYKLRPNNSFKNVIRNIATDMGRPSVMEQYNGAFQAYKIHYLNPTIKIK